ncbi:hypothetical protein [Streptomyces sp. cmx-18-6]|uniref:hypothetical protein n=1 Tax=Streptomyces sp. cmx-18-6 TaxID=2790930 RepID=UPI00397EB5E4
MPDQDTRSRADRCLAAVEAAPAALYQILHRSVLRIFERGRRSPIFDVDTTAWIRQAQRGESDPEEAFDMFRHSAECWALMTGFGIMAGMLLDYLFGVSFDLVVTLVLSTGPAFALMSGVDALRARSEQRRTTRTVRSKKGKGRKQTRRARMLKERTYTPLSHRWLVLVAGVALLTPIWLSIFFA